MPKYLMVAASLIFCASVGAQTPDTSFRATVTLLSYATAATADFSIVVDANDLREEPALQELQAGDFLVDGQCNFFTVFEVTTAGFGPSSVITFLAEATAAGTFPALGTPGALVRRGLNGQVGTVQGASDRVNTCLTWYNATLAPQVGEAGTLILSGFGVPNTNLGVVGDFYFDLDARRLHGPKNLSGWTSSISLTGSTGPAGPPGTSVTIVGSVATASDLPNPYSGGLGDMLLTDDNGNGHIWQGIGWLNVGTIRGPAGPSGTFVLGYGLTGQGTEAAPARVDTSQIATRARVVITVLEMQAVLIQVTATTGQNSIVAPFQINTDRPQQIARNGQILTLGKGYTRSGTTYNFTPIFATGEEIRILIFKQ